MEDIDVEKIKTTVGAKYLPASSTEEFRLEKLGSISPCLGPVLQIISESRFFKPRKSKHSPADKKKIPSMMNKDTF